VFQKILVPLDGSRTAELALPRAIELADRVSGTLHVVTVAHAGQARARAGAKGGPAPPGIDHTDLVRAAEAYLDEVGGRIAERSRAIEITGQVLPTGNGSIVSALLQEITAEEVDLVVMTTHGRGPFRRAWLGSVADGMTRQSVRPVLLVRPGESGGNGHQRLDLDAPPFRHILVPLDGSLDAEEALGYAREMALAEGARVSLLSVVSDGTGEASAYPALRAEGGGAGAGSEEGLAAARTALEESAGGLREQGIEVDLEVLRGEHPASAILDAAESTDVDLIVMTTRGRGGAPRLLLGRVVDKVVRGARVPVLVHRPRRRDEE
jgi:nucleotide-binding universal stress UspA family protein